MPGGKFSKCLLWFITSLVVRHFYLLSVFLCTSNFFYYKVRRIIERITTLGPDHKIPFGTYFAHSQLSGSFSIEFNMYLGKYLIFSFHSVYAAIMTALRTGELVSATAENTARFVETINNLFDALNSTRFHSTKPCNRALSDRNPEVITAINNGYELIENLYKVGKNNKLTRPDSFDGFLLTINAVKQFAYDQRNEGFNYLFTGRLIQDPLENQFSVYRQRGGYNRNPTVSSFRTAFKISIVSDFLRPSASANAGSKADDDENILVADNNEPFPLLNLDENSSSSESDDSDSSSSPSSTPATEFRDEVTLEKCSVVYFAGYLVKKCWERFGCEDCKITLEAPKNLENEDELLIFFKNYGLNFECGLKAPTSLLEKFTTIVLDCFSKDIGKSCNDKVMCNLKKKSVKCIKNFLPEWFATNIICSEHRRYILDLLLRTAIYKYCKNISSLLKSRHSSKNVKLSIVQHY